MPSYGNYVKLIMLLVVMQLSCPVVLLVPGIFCFVLI